MVLVCIDCIGLSGNELIETEAFKHKDDVIIG